MQESHPYIQAALLAEHRGADVEGIAAKSSGGCCLAAAQEVHLSTRGGVSNSTCTFPILMSDSLHVSIIKIRSVSSCLPHSHTQSVHYLGFLIKTCTCLCHRGQEKISCNYSCQVSPTDYEVFW